MKKVFFLILLIVSVNFTANAQQGNVKGKITDAKQSLPFATIHLNENIQIGATTDLDGSFEIIGVPVGSQTFVITFLGYVTKEIEVTIKEGETLDAGSILVIASNQQLDEVVLSSSIRHGQKRAINMRKSAPALMEVSSANLIGKLPDFNAAEAVQRLPGVSIERDQGEGRYVTVRGTPAQWSSNTLNGDRLPSAKTSGAMLGNRTVPLDVFPSDFIEYVQVVKAITPDYEGDAIGGTINFITKTSPGKETVNLNLSGAYNDQSKQGGYSATALYGNRLLNNKLGFIALVTRNKRSYGTDNYEVKYGNDNNLVDLDLRHYTGVRTTDGFNIGMDYKLGDNTKIYARGLSNKMVDNERRRQAEYFFTKSSNNAQFNLGMVDYLFKTYGGEVGLSTKLSNKLKADFKVSTYKAFAGYDGPNSVEDSKSGYYYARFRQSVSFDGLEDVTDGSGNIKKLKFLQGDGPNPTGGDRPDNIQPQFSGGALNPDLFKLNRYVISIRDVEDRDITAQANFTYKANPKFELKFGIKERGKKSSYRRAYVKYTPSVDAFFTDFTRESFPRKEGFLAEIGSPYSAPVFLWDIPTEESVSDPFGNSVAGGSMVEKYDDKTNSKYAANSYDGTEDQIAGYLMGTLKLNDKWTLIPGFRFENTSNEITGYTYNQTTKETGSIKSSTNYNAFLPMMHFKYSPSDNLDFRAAFTRTFARQAFNQIAPVEDINEEGFTIRRGNPNLNPTFSNNYDLIVSKYFGGSNYFSAGVFYKDISDFVQPFKTDETMMLDGSPTIFTVSTYENSESAKLRGFEITWVQQLDFLPGALNGFGYSTNYTYTKSESSIVDRGAKVALVNQSPNIFNASLFYEKYGFSFRLAGNYRDAFLWSLGDNADQDVYQGKNFQLDFNTSYSFPNDRITIFAQINNLTNQKLLYYRGTINRPQQTEFYSVRGRIGISYSF